MQWWRLTWLVARREMTERGRAVSFKVTTGLLVLVVLAGVIVPALLSGGEAGSPCWCRWAGQDERSFGDASGPAHRHRRKGSA
jgi:hypothetical protein